MKAGLLAIVFLLTSTIAACSATSPTDGPSGPTNRLSIAKAPPMKPTDTDLSVAFVSINGTSVQNSFPNTQIAFAFTNVSGKNIKGIKGNIWAYDRFGECLGSLEGVDIEASITASSSLTVEETWWDKNDLTSLLQKFPKGPIFKWETTKVVYE